MRWGYKCLELAQWWGIFSSWEECVGLPGLYSRYWRLDLQ